MGATTQQPTLGKADIVHHLIDRFGYRHYLEIATSTTGFCFHAIDRSRLTTCKRLLYNVPPGFDDGQPIDYLCPGLDIAPALAAIAAEGAGFDVMLVDPYHTYPESYRDLAAAFDMLAPGGAIVVHDCLPPNEDQAQLEFKIGLWCGVTYKAYLDFVLRRSDLRYFTIDTDFGCGIIRKVRTPMPLTVSSLRRWLDRRAMTQAWRALGDDYPAVWRYFSDNAQELLRLVSAESFLSGEGLASLK